MAILIFLSIALLSLDNVSATVETSNVTSSNITTNSNDTNNITATTNSVSTFSAKSTVNNTAPTIKSVDPAFKAANVPVNKTIKVTFSESIKTGTGWIELKDSNGKAVSFTKSISGSVLTIKPTSNLTPGTTYTLSIHTGSLTDLSGTPVALYKSTFTTTDGTAPTIKSVDPAFKAVYVPVNKTIKVTFSESIKIGNGWIELKDSNGKAVSFTKSISGSVLTIKPTSNLTPGTTYTL
ncbi:Ig-like domain-containing protein, partial [Methanobacterium sp.]|uniref:Ig-like domain-containing protein n=1 Tax=Methanobacterium sp. TaxID=2164 RepID=UPI003C727CA5